RAARKVTPRVVGGMAPPALAAMQPASVTFLRCEAAGGRCSRMAGTFSSVPTARRRVVEQHRHVIGTGVGDGEIEAAIVVEVADGDGYRSGACRDGRRRPEGPVAGAEQDRDVVRVKVGDREIEVAIAVEVADGDRQRRGARREGPG